MMKKRILVSATSITSGGALTILKQFISNADGLHEYHLVLNDKLSLDSEYVGKHNFRYVFVSENNRIDRVKWDLFGAKNYMVESGLIFDLVISLQNTSLRVGDIPQIIYLHQGISLHDRSWSFFDRRERGYAIYKYIYPIFIRLFSRTSTHFVVQTEWMKSALISKFYINEANVHNIKPEVLTWSSRPEWFSKGSGSKITFFYPASAEIFKNHLLILEAIKNLYEAGVNIACLEFFFTLDIDAPQCSHISEFLDNNLAVAKCINFLGVVSYNEVKKLYERSDIVIYPSEIESFGLPLIEGALFGKEVLCLDTAFAREVLKGYAGAVYLDNDLQAWVSVFLSLFDRTDFSHQSYEPNYDTSWKDFFNLF